MSKKKKAEVSKEEELEEIEEIEEIEELEELDEVQQARDPGQGQGTGILNEILSLYDSIERNNAVVALRLWQRDADYQMALDDVG